MDKTKYDVANKYDVLIEKIQGEQDIRIKVDDLAVMMFMIATHDLSGIGARFDAVNRKLDETLASVRKEAADSVLACSTTMTARIDKNEKHVKKLIIAIFGILLVLIVTHPDIAGLAVKFFKLIF